MKKIKAKYTIINPEIFIRMPERIEEIARTCYKSVPKGQPETFVRMLRDRHHEAMLEHGGMLSVQFEVDRGVTHEMVRHRLHSFAQESTRYCNYAKDKFESSVAYIDIAAGIQLDSKMQKLSGEQIDAILEVWRDACLCAEKYYFRMLELGASPQIARGVLNNSTKATITLSANPRSWRTFCKLRAAKDAHPMMREVVVPLLRELIATCPCLFDDLEDLL